MRIDLLMNKLCLTKTRSIAKNACDKGLILVNGKAAKASLMVKANDIVEMKLYGYLHQFRIKELPMGNVSKKDAGNYYEMLKREPLE
ncbi:MAG: S4 domain-containing protein [Candidatus Cloacimonetes bacterium]|nr:S4 domain-containing protein [Candidatus Cloacimonadota bacterium]MDD2505824.1 S4 domain-containing protein [Candidatus Cloacimonadota bacterium]MDD4147064.1 S4 domain-containing protein [Candidatus Cloacimonadota bacterium]MDD4559453.1 S4 domain-containing protein [Candidatus Cloacimonadota bacterium]